MNEADCPICEKHLSRGPLVGPVVYDDELILVTHWPSGSLGYLFIEPRTELDPESVHSFVAGRGVAHFHEHLFVRPRGTPPEHEWWQQWADAPVGDIDDLARRLAGYLR